MSRRSTPPKYAQHSSGQARVRIDGKVHYLGSYGSPDSYRRYASLVAEWQAQQAEAPQNLSVGQLTVLYARHCDGHYVKNGKPTSQIHIVRCSLRRLNQFFRETQASEFSPRMLKRVRESFIADGLSRKTVNEYTSIIRPAFRWAVSDEFVTPTVLLGLQSVRDLQAGRSGVRETAPVRAVPDARIDALQPHVPLVVWAMIQLQRLTGMRPGEVLIVRGCDLNTTGEVWEYTPAVHKLEHKGISRVVMIGPAAQEVLRPFLRTDTQAYLFSPDPDGSRPYRRDSYANAIRRGCELAFGMPDKLRNIGRTIKRLKDLTDERRRELRAKLAAEAAAWRAEHCWSPNQLRHSFATMARRAAGIEAARVTLGHSSAVTSEIYAERDLEAARAVVARIG